MKLLVDEMPSDKGECSFSDTFWNGYFWDYCCSLGQDGATDCDLENGVCSKLHLHDLLSADRPQGEWIVNISDYKSVCSVCGANETDFIYGTEMWYGLGESKFCPSCGARMKGA